MRSEKEKLADRTDKQTDRQTERGGVVGGRHWAETAAGGKERERARCWLSGEVDCWPLGASVSLYGGKHFHQRSQWAGPLDVE